MHSKRLARNIRRFVAIGGLPFVFSATCIAQVNQGTSPSSHLLSTLARIADTGPLFDLEALVKQLNMELDLAVEDTGDQPSKCTESWGVRRVAKTRGTSTVTSWFAALPGGAGRLDIPAFSINPAYRTGDAKVIYEKQRRVSCSGGSWMRDHTRAELTFIGVPTYACITRKDILKEIPKAYDRMATDGVSLLAYQGLLDDSSSAYLVFHFRFGSDCALSATITQDMTSGLRYRRAAYKLAMCRRTTDREVCAARPELKWPATALREAMDQRAAAVCGEIDDLYRNEPETGARPPPFPPRRYDSTPCDE